MKTLFLSAVLMMGMTAVSAHASEPAQCEDFALKMGKAIRMVEDAKGASQSKFEIVARELSEESETYIIRMTSAGEAVMTDQRITAVGGAMCVMAAYDMPGAG